MEANPLELTDAQLVQATLRGKDAAFDELVSRYRSRTFYLALSKVGSREAALDIAQEAFVQAYVSLATLREPERFAAWLGSIASHACGTYLRKARDLSVPIETIEMLSNNQARGTESELDAAVARAALERLPNGTRAVASLYFIEEMKQMEIAEFLGISLAAVKSRIRDARARLQKEMIHMVKQTAKKEEPADEFDKSLKHRLELARFYREFSEMIDAGVTLVRSLFILSEGNYSATIRDAAIEVRLAVESGSTLSDALADAPELRTPESVGLVRAGEIGGCLELSMRSLVRCIDARSLQKDIELYTWCRTLGEILSAGVGIVHAFQCATDITTSPDLKKATADVIQAIYECKPPAAPTPCPISPLVEALRRHAETLTPMVAVAMHSSMESGTLDKALQWLADDLALDVARRIGPPGVLARQKPPGGEYLDTPTTRDHLRSELPSMRCAAAILLGRIGAKVAAPEIAQLLWDPDPDVQKAAIRAIVDLDFRAASDALVSCLASADESVRWLTARAIADLNLHDAAPAIAAMIPGTDARTSRAAISALEAMGEIDALTARAIELVASDDPHAITTGVCILVDHPTPAAGDVLAAKNAEDIGIAVALGKIGRREAVPTLRKLLAERRWTWWTNTAAELLGGLGDVDSAPLMRKAVEDGEIDRRFLEVADRLEGK